VASEGHGNDHSINVSSIHPHVDPGNGPVTSH